MSLLEQSLELFGFKSLNDVTHSELKKAFKRAIITAHPDKANLNEEGATGTAVDVDTVLSSFVFLSETVQRLFGGRTTLTNIVSPDELRSGRADEIINRIFEEFDNEAFNKAFEEARALESSNLENGYKSWLSNKTADTNVLEDGRFGEATQKAPTFGPEDLNNVFLAAAKFGKSEPHAIILHPDEMALTSGKCLGVSIIQETGGTYTSGPDANPEYTDLYSAFTSDNTICDKVPTFSEVAAKTIEDLLKEREAELKPTEDDLGRIAEWEKARFETESKHQQKLKTHFGELTSGIYLLGTEVLEEEKDKGFVINC